MFATSLVGKFFSAKLEQGIDKLIPVFAIILVLIFILSGLSLGIPFISPPEKMLVPHEKMMMK